MIRPKVSVIMPAYNCEKYIGKCLESLIHQTLKPLEIIVIDDGSTDTTGAIIDKYSLEYDNFIVVHQKNKGVATARNRGLSLVKGEYIGFIDSDDYCDPEMFEKMFLAAKEFDADMVMCDYNMEYDSKTIMNVLKLKNNHICVKDFGLRNFYLDYIMVCHVLWNKIFKASTVHLANIGFYMNAGEDFLFCIEITPYIKKAIMLSESYYNYIQRKSSITNSTKPPRPTSTLINMFVKRIQNNAVYVNDSEIKIYHLIFATMFTGLMFSPSCIGQSGRYFFTQIKIMRQWRNFPDFCRIISKTSELEDLYKSGAISVRFYNILKIIFYFCYNGMDKAASFLMFITSRLIYIKKRKLLKKNLLP